MPNSSEEGQSGPDWGTVHLVFHALCLDSFIHFLSIQAFYCPRYGNREGFSNVEKAKVHGAAVKFQQEVDLSLHENVPQYVQDRFFGENFVYSNISVILKFYTRTCYWKDFLDEHLPKHKIEAALCSPPQQLILHAMFCAVLSVVRLDPRMFGHPNTRLRAWRICFRKRVFKWTCKLSFQELAEKLLHNHMLGVNLNFNVYMQRVPVQLQIKEPDLTECLCINFRKILHTVMLL